MDFRIFRKPYNKFSAVIFCTEAALRIYKSEFETLDQQKNLKLIIQPLPEEGISFLTKLSKDFQGDIKKTEREIFLEAYTLDPKTPYDVIVKIAKLQYQRICAVLEGNSENLTDSTLEFIKFKSYLRFYK